MAPLSDAERLQDAWRALAGAEPSDGWRTIALGIASPCPILAGRRFPGNDEAILVGFRVAKPPGDQHLPRGRGFQVVRVPDLSKGDGTWWLGLARHPAADPTLFGMMASDVISLLHSQHVGSDEGAILKTFLGRVRAWQGFMERGRGSVLSPDAEVGLFGELKILDELLGSGQPGRLAVERWVGPLGAEQDFNLGTGAIEVKTTIASAGFPATIGSLDQLDDSARSPLFLAAVRLLLTGTGESLPERIADLRARLRSDLGALADFDSKLLEVGYLDVMATEYVRRFTCKTVEVIPVTEGFPRVTRADVPTAIQSVRYELDADQITIARIGLDAALAILEGSRGT